MRLRIAEQRQRLLARRYAVLLREGLLVLFENEADVKDDDGVIVKLEVPSQVTEFKEQWSNLSLSSSPSVSETSLNKLLQLADGMLFCFEEKTLPLILCISD